MIFVFFFSVRDLLLLFSFTLYRYCLGEGLPMSQAKDSDRFIMVHQIFESTKWPKMEESKWPTMSYQRCWILSWPFVVESALVFLLLRLTWLHFAIFFLDSLGGSVCCFLLRKAYIANIRWGFFQNFNSVVVRSLMSSNRNQGIIFRLHFHDFWCGPIFPGCGQMKGDIGSYSWPS